MVTRPLRVAHLSDTHFIEPGEHPEGGHGYDVAEAFDAVLEHLAGQARPDLVVVTGDVADHGRPGQYEIAAECLCRLPAPVFVCPGNHDLDAAFRHGFDRSGIHVARSTHHGPWTFVFADSNAGVMASNPTARRIDPAGEDRLHCNGSLGATEVRWLRAAAAGDDTDHVFVWVHHPPAVDVPWTREPAYTAEWDSVVDACPKIRGFGAGHTHMPTTYAYGERTVYVAPSLKNNFDLEASTWLPPGYRTYDFHGDGTIESQLHLLDDERWPRRPFGRTLRSLFMGEISFNDLAEIVARRSGP